MNVRRETLEQWSVKDSMELYGINDWSAGYFTVNSEGEVAVTPFRLPGTPAVSLMDIVKGVKERGMNMPVLLRIGNILDSQIQLLHNSFEKAIKQTGYKGVYKGVYPIKVNQQQQVIEEITKYGMGRHHGLEAGHDRAPPSPGRQMSTCASGKKSRSGNGDGNLATNPGNTLHPRSITFQSMADDESAKRGEMPGAIR